MDKLKFSKKSLKNFTYTDKETADDIYSSINGTQFLGVSVGLILFTLKKSHCNPFQGVVAFSSQGDRIALTQIEQMTDGKYVLLGYYDTQSDNLTWNNKEKWMGILRQKILKYSPNILKQNRWKSTSRQDNCQNGSSNSITHPLCVHGGGICGWHSLGHCPDYFQHSLPTQTSN
jgi:hypothetical protein